MGNFLNKTGLNYLIGLIREAMADITSGLIKKTDSIASELTNAIILKADKVTNATNGNLAALDASGNLTDSGKKVSDFAADLVVSTTYSELKTLRDGRNLVAGTWYRITDYECTTSQANTQSAGHQFDILVQAIDKSHLSEEAKACHSSSGSSAWTDTDVWNDNNAWGVVSDNYFADSKLDAWQIWYCLDNDTNRFIWADNVNGKGVIYRMIDEFDNDCPYDFKNIQFRFTSAISQSGIVANVYYYTFSVATDTNDATVTDHSLNGSYCHSNKIGQYVKQNKPTLSSNVFRNTSATAFCYSNTFGDYCYTNTFGTSCQRNTFGDNCQSNTFGDGCYCNTFGNDCKNNNIGENGEHIVFGNTCIRNNFSYDCRYNTFGNNCRYNNFGYECLNNSFGDNCDSNTFGNCCDYNTFGNRCEKIRFDKSCTWLCVVENGNQYITLTSTQTTSWNNPLRNITIAQGVNNTSTNKSISHNTVDDTFQTIYANDASSNLKTWVSADIVKNSGDTMTGALILHDHPNASSPVKQAATKGYVDDSIANITKPVVFKGTLGVGGTITSLPAASSANEGFEYKVITAGTYDSQSADVGDVFVSNGSAWVLIPSGDDEEMVNQVSVTYSELKTLRNGGNLIAGTWYRITDYITTTAQTNTQSTGHRFDIIVRADDESHLNENAYATLHNGDTYFSNSKLDAWELKYCLDNDTNRFAWADDTNGKGVIYYMKDEWNNECPYDFKNIQFKRYKITACTKSPHLVGSYGIIGVSNYTVDSSTSYWCYTFCVLDTHDNYAAHDVSVEQELYLNEDNYYNHSHDNVFKPYYTSVGDDEMIEVMALPNNVCVTDTSIIGTSAFYAYYSNTFGDNCYSNTFGNDYYSNTFGDGCYANTFGNYCLYNTFGNNCYNNIFVDDCYNNTFRNGCSGNTFGDGCYANTFGNYCESNTFGNFCYYNTFGNNCDSNTFENTCQYNTFGNNCSTSTFGNTCRGNTFRNDCHYNIFGYSCESNTFEDGCQENTFGNYCVSNTFRTNCLSNTFGNMCRHTTFGNNCVSNTFGDNCGRNIFGNGCSNNALGNNCHSNTLGNSCIYSTFGYNCENNILGNNCATSTFGDTCCDNTFGNNCNHITFSENYTYYCIIENGNRYITLTSTQTTSSINILRNITIAQGVNNTMTAKTISHNTVNDIFKTTYQPANSQVISV